MRIMTASNIEWYSTSIAIFSDLYSAHSPCDNIITARLSTDLASDIRIATNA